MPVNSKIFYAYQLEFAVWGSVSASNSGTGPFANSYSALLQVLHATSASFSATPIELSLSSTYDSDGVDSWDISVTTPGGSYSNSGTAYVSKTLSLVLTDVTVYHTNGGFRTVVGSAQIYDAGSPVGSLSGWTTNISRLAPDSIPCLAATYLSGAVAAAGQDGSGVAGAFESTAHSTGTIGGGFRFKETSLGSWIAGDIVTPSTITDIPVGTTTYDDQFNVSHLDYHGRFGTSPSYTGETEYEMRQGSMWIFPNWTKVFNRFNTDAKTLVRRLVMPSTVVRNTLRTGVLPPVITNTDSTVQAGVSAGLFYMNDTAGSDENSLLQDSVCPAQYGYAYEHGTTAGGADFDPVVTGLDTKIDKSTVFPYSITSFTDYRTHSISVFNYLNTWVNPHWAYLLKTNNWPVDGSPETWNDYWKKVSQQWLYDSSITSPETRNHLISEGCDNDTKSSWCDTYLGGERFLGLSRWLTKTITPRTDYTFTSGSSSLWSASEGTISMDDTEITVTPPEIKSEEVGVRRT